MWWSVSWLAVVLAALRRGGESARFAKRSGGTAVRTRSHGGAERASATNVGLTTFFRCGRELGYGAASARAAMRFASSAAALETYMAQAGARRVALLWKCFLAASVFHRVGVLPRGGAYSVERVACARH